MRPPEEEIDLYRGWSDLQLVESSTLGGSSAGAELTRRFMEATRESSRRMEALTKVLVGLTVAIVLLTGVLVWLTAVLLGGG